MCTRANRKKTTYHSNRLNVNERDFYVSWPKKANSIEVEVEIENHFNQILPDIDRHYMYIRANRNWKASLPCVSFDDRKDEKKK